MQAIGQQVVRALRENWLFLLVVGGIVAGFLVLRTPASPVSSINDVEAVLQGGQPALVEFYTNT